MEARDLQEGYYEAKPYCWGFTETKNGTPQYAIEFEVFAHSEAGPETVLVLHRQGFSNDKGVEILTEQLRACGWTGSDFGAVELNKETLVRVLIGHDDYGVKIKGVYPKNGSSAVQRFALAEDKRKAVAAELNERLRQMGLAAPATAPVSVAHPSNTAKPRPATATTTTTPAAQAPRSAPAPRPAPQTQRAAQPAQTRQAAKPAARPAPAPQEQDDGWFGAPEGASEAAPEETPF